MRFLLIIWILLGAILACCPQVAFSSDDQHRLVGRWELTSTGMPVPPRQGGYVVIGSTAIRVKDNCNELTLRYSLKGDELSATPLTTTLLACYPPSRFSDESRSVYDAILHSRYQIEGDVLCLFSLSDSAVDYRLEFHRVR
jgi:hypothetical protein